MLYDPNPDKTRAEEEKRAAEAVIDENSLIQGTKWEKLKESAMDPEYQATDWYKSSTNYEKLILARL